jgi:DNA-binding PadR family transcriptional regulator
MSPKPQEPLTPKAFHILLALSHGAANGYQITARAEENARGRVRLSPGTLYENLHRLHELGWLAEVKDDPTLNTDGRGQRFYELTELGVQVLSEEVRRLSEDVRLATDSLLSRLDSSR